MGDQQEQDARARFILSCCDQCPRLRHEQSLSRDLIPEIHDHATAHDAGILSYVDDRIVTPASNEWVEVERSLTGMDVVEVPDFKVAMDRDAIKVIVVELQKH